MCLTLALHHPYCKPHLFEKCAITRVQFILGCLGFSWFAVLLDLYLASSASSVAVSVGQLISCSKGKYFFNIRRCLNPERGMLLACGHGAELHIHLGMLIMACLYGYQGCDHPLSCIRSSSSRGKACDVIVHFVVHMLVMP
jgi:hypothetical protein